jgi:hypothetical protein
MTALNFAYSERYRLGKILSGIRGAVVVDGAMQGLNIFGVVVVVKGLLIGNDLATT